MGAFVGLSILHKPHKLLPVCLVSSHACSRPALGGTELPVSLVNKVPLLSLLGCEQCILPVAQSRVGVHGARGHL